MQILNVNPDYRETFKTPLTTAFRKNVFLKHLTQTLSEITKNGLNQQITSLKESVPFVTVYATCVVNR